MGDFRIEFNLIQDGEPRRSPCQSRFELISPRRICALLPREPRTASSELGPWEIWPWVLEDLIPEAAHAANDGVPSVVIWYFQLPH